MYSDVSAAGIYGGARGIYVEGNYAYLACGNIGGTGKLVILDANFPKIGLDHTNLNWAVSVDQNWLNCFPSSGTNNGEVLVAVDTIGLSAGTYNGTITISDPKAVNSPQTVAVRLDVYQTGQLSVPFGVFATPLDGSTVTGSIAVTGWVLDDTGVQSLQVYRKQGNNLVYIGDAYFVEGARPDVEQAYPSYPMNYKAGWGYMMLTNFLPNGGNGTFDIEAIATDIEGNQVSLGTKTIICDNTNAVKPFGAIDTPMQGGTASGSIFINWGWALTPQPNIIPTDGSTINVYIDGINLGNPTYNLPRPDVESVFPGYANSSGPGGYFSLDTTAYENGVHTIQWTASDSDNNSDGIGSRYFTIQNIGAPLTQAQTASFNRKKTRRKFSPLPRNPNVPINDFDSISIRRGLTDDSELEVVTCEESGVFIIKIEELERLMIEFPGNDRIIAGYTEIGNFFRPLPIGSALDTQTGRFYWHPGPGFIGEYILVFIERMDSNRMKRKKNVIVRIEPKFTNYKNYKD
ncbi:MAG: BACON domain-containing protein [Candidatus Aminicenantes bacterium]|nr:MAG: BACON domain-containing protein [Candidatus Aminicenantes bacterium]